VDDPRTILMGRQTFASPYTVALTWDASYVDYLRDAGFPVVRHMPLAADNTVFNAAPATTWEHPPTFVGHSMVDFAEGAWTWVNERPALAEAIRDALDSGRVTRQRFAEGLEAILDPAFAAGLDVEERRHAELLFFVEGTHRLRRELVRTLRPEGLEVRGDEGWKTLFPDAGGPIDYFQQLPQFYRACEINLNLTSVQMPTTVNQRVFDCPAAGGFLLTDAQPALEELFDSPEVACYSCFEECRYLYRRFRAHPEARRAIAARAHKRVMGEHTYAHRLQAIAGILKERFAG